MAKGKGRSGGKRQRGGARRSALDRITNGSIRRLARRGGVKRISAGIYGRMGGTLRLILRTKKGYLTLKIPLHTFNFNDFCTIRSELMIQIHSRSHFFIQNLNRGGKPLDLFTNSCDNPHKLACWARCSLLYWCCETMSIQGFLTNCVSRSEGNDRFDT